jgi:MFS family permease
VLFRSVARAHLGGPAAWGAITAAEAVGLIIGGLASLRFSPRRPMLFVVAIGAAMAISPLSLGLLWPLPVVCLASFGLGITMEITMVQWTVTMARNIPRAKLARVSSYDGLGSVIAMPVGALLAGPLAAAVGVSATEYGAVAVIVVASALAVIPREVRGMRTPDRPGEIDSAEVLRPGRPESPARRTRRADASARTKMMSRRR